MGVQSMLVARAQQAVMMPQTTTNLLIALLVLVVFCLLLVLALYAIRRHRHAKQSVLPVHNDEKLPVKKSHHRRLSGLILSSASFRRQSKPIFVFKEKQAESDHSVSPPDSPLPEIRITFPDEVDESGKRNSGRVYVVRVGEQGSLGLEPLSDDLPSYQLEATDRFHSLDLDRIGGLKEKMPPLPAQQH